MHADTPLRCAPAPTTAARNQSRAPSLRVLVVDDNVSSAQSLAMVLKLDGHEVQVTHDGGDALEAVRRFRPEVVLMDIGLPGMDGYEVARRLRAGRGAGNGDRTSGRRHGLRRGRGPAPFARGRLRPPSCQTGRPRRRAGALGLAGMGDETRQSNPFSIGFSPI